MTCMYVENQREWVKFVEQYMANDTHPLGSEY